MFIKHGNTVILWWVAWGIGRLDTDEQQRRLTNLVVGRAVNNSDILDRARPVIKLAPLTAALR